MIERVTGNLFDAKAEAYVNTVNCVGVMGKGLALQFKKAYPENYKFYRQACASGELRPGKMLVYDAGFSYDYNPKYIINFPTKNHWRGKSRMEWIESGLDALVREIEDRGISSIAVPALGSDNGGLNWSDVQPCIESKLAPLDQVKVFLYVPLKQYQRAEASLSHV